MSLPFSDQDILSVLKDRLSLLYTQNQDLNQKAQLYITLMSAALSLAAVFNVFKRTHDVIETVLLVSILLMYGIGLYIALKVVSDHSWQHPVDINDFKTRRDTNRAAFDDGDYFDFIFSTYVTVANFNQGIIDRKVNRIRFAYWFTVGIFTATLFVIIK